LALSRVSLPLGDVRLRRRIPVPRLDATPPPPGTPGSARRAPHHPRQCALSRDPRGLARFPTLRANRRSRLSRPVRRRDVAVPPPASLRRYRMVARARVELRAGLPPREYVLSPPARPRVEHPARGPAPPPSPLSGHPHLPPAARASRVRAHRVGGLEPTDHVASEPTHRSVDPLRRA